MRRRGERVGYGTPFGYNTLTSNLYHAAHPRLCLRRSPWPPIERKHNRISICFIVISFKYDALALVYSRGNVRKKGRRIVGMLTASIRSGCWDIGRDGRWLERDSGARDYCRDQRCGRCIQWSSNGDRLMSYHKVCGGGDDGKPSNDESQVRVEGELHIFLLKRWCLGDFWCMD